MSEALLVEAKRLLCERTGITVPAYRERLLDAELGRLGGGDPRRGLELLREGEQQLLEDVAGVFAVAETYLFRGPEQYRELRRLALAAVARELPFQVLCAGVSTGEEAWSAAMVVAEVYEGTDLPYHVRGWELSQERLVRARHGRFGRWSARGGFMGHERHLVEVEGGYEVVPALRRRVSFEHVNLVGALPPTGRVFDVIFFRNVSLYWNRRLASEVAEALGQRLGLRGSLFVGPSDPIELPRETWAAEPQLTWRIYRRREPSLARFDGPPAPARAPGPRPSSKVAVPRRILAVSPAPKAAPAPPSASMVTSDELIGRVRALADQGDYDRALALLDDRDESPAPELLELAGIIHLDRGDPRAAITCFRAAVYWAPGVPAHARWLELAIRTRDQLEARSRAKLPSSARSSRWTSS